MEVPTLTALGVELWSGTPFCADGVNQAVALPFGTQEKSVMLASEWHRRAMLARWLVACSNACRGVPLDMLERVADRRERKPDLADALAAMFEGFGSER